MFARRRPKLTVNEQKEIEFVRSQLKTIAKAVGEEETEKANESPITIIERINDLEMAICELLEAFTEEE